MAVLASIATGNFLTAGTWGLVDATSYLNAENATESLLTTAYSGTRSQSFTPGAIVVSHIGVKLCERIGTTGTMSVHLATSADHVEVAGTEVTINVADLPSALETDLNGGWIFFKLATPVTLAAATGYEVEAKTSSATQVDLWCDATVDNISRALITTTTQAPAAGDDLIVAGEKTGAGTENNFTVTMNETATTDYGAASTSLVTPAIAICDGGILRNGVTAATNYNLKVSGNIIVYSGGELDLGTTGTPMPRDSSMTLQFDCASNVDFGLTVRNLGTFVSQGLSRTSGKNVVSCKLNTDEAAGQTVLGVDTDTGWLNGDVIAIASTTRTAAECESATLSGNATATEITVTAGITNAHSGTSPTQAEVILLTRNVKIQGASATLQAYVDIKATATVDVDWTEFKWLGSATALKRGIDIAVTTGSQTFDYCSLHNFEVASSRGFNITTTPTGTFAIRNCVTFLIAAAHLTTVTSGTTANMIIDDNIFMRTTDSSTELCNSSLAGSNISFDNNVFVGATSNGIRLHTSTASSDYTNTTFAGLTSHSNATNGVQFEGGVACNISMSNVNAWRNNNAGLNFNISAIGQVSNLTITTINLFGNGTNNINIISPVYNLQLISLTSNGDTTFSTTNGLTINALATIKLINSDFGTVTGIKTAHTQDLNIANSNIGFMVNLNNTKLASSTELANQTNMSSSSFISSQKHNQTAATHKTWKKYGIITIEGTTVHTGAKAYKMTPNNASNKLVSGSIYIAVANGATLTPSVYVQENAAYNGARARLILKRNDAIGITADTVIDTATAASDEAWEQLTGTTASATDDGVMEFVVDCDGTAGDLFVDSFTVS